MYLCARALNGCSLIMGPSAVRIYSSRSVSTSRGGGGGGGGGGGNYCTGN